MSFHTRLIALTVSYLLAGVATLYGVVTLDRPWSFVALGVGLAVLTTLFVLLMRTRRPPVEGNPDPWAPLIATLRGQSDEALIARRAVLVRFAEASSPLELHDLQMRVIDEQMAERRIALCPCGARKSGGADSPTCTCQES